MRVEKSNEQRFIAALDALEFVDRGAGAMVHSLENWLARQLDELKTRSLASAALNPQSALARTVAAINTARSDRVEALSHEWADLEAAEALADIFRDRMLLLVFGKFNSGKSSFCNLLAERFIALGHTAQFFYIEKDRAVEWNGPFAEGATEATARLQGVKLGKKLVVLDTPGLHSMTKENASLTQRFVESADGLLWLTSSTSPGQVQELEGLSRELRRKKPLLPVVTRSDYFDEDEIDGEICKVLCNKSPDNRALQERDIEIRAKQKLLTMGIDDDLLKAPVSISAYLARQDKGTPAAMIGTGMERLYGTLLDMTGATVSYKARKEAEMLLHHLEENVAGMLRRAVFPRLDEIETAAHAAVTNLRQQQFEIASSVWRTVMPVLPRLLDEYANTRDAKAMYDGLALLISESFRSEATERLGDYVLPAQLMPQHGDARVRCDPVHLENGQKAGTAYSIETDKGIDFEHLYGRLDVSLRKTVNQLSQTVVDWCSTSLASVTEDAVAMRERLEAHEEELRRVERRMRASPALER